MTQRQLTIGVGGLILILLAVGVAGAVGGWPVPAAAAEDSQATVVDGGINFQGRLTGPDGEPLSGNQTMRFVIYDAPVAGSGVWDSGALAVAVSDGLFTVQLDVDPAVFDGRALWLSAIVDDEQLSPRQEILPVPYALSLRPGASIVGDEIGPSEAILSGRAPATGTAFRADSGGGAGVYETSDGSYGVWGASNNSWGGYFTSEGGYGIRVNTDGSAHFDHGAYITSSGGYGVYAQSASNQAVRGEAGNVTGIAQPLGAVGVVGIGANRGTYGSSAAGSGLYGNSVSNYGLWAQSTEWRGATGRTNRTDNNYGPYTPDNLFAANTHLTGATMQVMKNGGTTPLSPGDVVVFSGINRSVPAVDGPVVQVSHAVEASSTAVAGVVFSRFNVAAIDPALETPDDSAQGGQSVIEITPAGDAAPGEFVLVVVQGPAEVRVDALGGTDIQPGDLLATGSQPGLASRAAVVNTDGVPTHRPGTVFGKALETPAAGQDRIYVYVTLQ